MNAPFNPSPSTAKNAASALGSLARLALEWEIEAWPKPGLVTPRDSGSHSDMSYAMLRRSAELLEPYFAALAEAGIGGASMDDLRAIGLVAEAAMLQATGGVNTHRGAIFGLGLLCAAAGLRTALGAEAGTLGQIIQRHWGDALRTVPPASSNSHGAAVSRRFGVAGARGEAALGLPTLYQVGLPALRHGRATGSNEEAARIQALFALMSRLDDTNLLHRGGRDGLLFAQSEAFRFLAEGGVAAPDWQQRALACHHRFVARRLSPGGSADLLAMTLFVDAVEKGE